MAAKIKIEQVNRLEAYAVQTPLEKIIGIKCAEETYDQLNIREQVILDLLIVGWTQGDIAAFFEVKPPNISSSLRRIRYRLANGKLHQTLQLRQIMRDGEIR